MSIPSFFKCLFLLFSGALLITAAAVPTVAQNSSSNAVVSDFLKVYSTSADKVEQLAEAIPEENYDWRPAEGVRSVGEAVLHVAGSNYFFGSKLGGKMPEGVNPQSFNPESMTKDEIITALKESIGFMKATINSLNTAALNEEIDMFGNSSSKQEVMFIVGDHTGEHLGQLIAYARSNSVTPPWSRGQ